MAIQNTSLRNLYFELQGRCGDDCGLLLTEEVFEAALQDGLSKLEVGQTLAVKSIPVVSFTAAISPNPPDVELVPGPGLSSIVSSKTMMSPTSM